jgi:hypothetical protein
MTRQEFDAIVDDAVKNGADRKEAEEYVISGFKLEGKPGESKKEKVKGKK